MRCHPARTCPQGDQFGYCPPWALAWPYRKLNLLKELLAYDADIMCLQEVQSNHFQVGCCGVWCAGSSAPHGAAHSTWLQRCSNRVALCGLPRSNSLGLSCSTRVLPAYLWRLRIADTDALCFLRCRRRTFWRRSCRRLGTRPSTRRRQRSCTRATRECLLVQCCCLRCCKRAAREGLFTAAACLSVVG